jgi:hypothetical protein
MTWLRKDSPPAVIEKIKASQEEAIRYYLHELRPMVRKLASLDQDKPCCDMNDVDAYNEAKVVWNNDFYKIFLNPLYVQLSIRNDQVHQKLDAVDEKLDLVDKTLDTAKRDIQDIRKYNSLIIEALKKHQLERQCAAMGDEKPIQHAPEQAASAEPSSAYPNKADSNSSEKDAPRSETVQPKAEEKLPDQRTGAMLNDVAKAGLINNHLHGESNASSAQQAQVVSSSVVATAIDNDNSVTEKTRTSTNECVL